MPGLSCIEALLLPSRQILSMTANVIIPAAGLGRRMGAGRNKQYLQLAGKPIVAHSLELFEQNPLIEKIYLVLPGAEIDFFTEKILPQLQLTKLARIVAGGHERQDSVSNALQQLSFEQVKADSIVLIHDGARPLFNPAKIAELIGCAATQGGAICAVPVKDTIKQVENDRIWATPERKNLWQAQTPQAFRFELLFRAYQNATAENFRGTDDASLVERLGLKVMVVMGDYRNLKITTPEDLCIAEALMKMGEK